MVSGMKPIDAPPAGSAPQSPYAPPNLALMQARRPPPPMPPQAPKPSGPASHIAGIQAIPAYGPLPGQPRNMRGGLPGEASGAGWGYTCNPSGEGDPPPAPGRRPKSP